MVIGGEQLKCLIQWYGSIIGDMVITNQSDAYIYLHIFLFFLFSICKYVKIGEYDGFIFYKQGRA